MSAPVSTPSAPDLTPEYVAFTNAPSLLAQAGSVFGIATAVVVLRIYVRLCMIRSFGKDDWTMVLAMVSSLWSLMRLRQLNRPAACHGHVRLLRA